MTILDRLYASKRGVGVVGHRGSRATHPENTLEAFRHAIQCGADAVELDIVVTRDGKLAVTHDPVDASFRELPVSVPQLADVLALAPGNEIVFDIEMKYCGRLTPPPREFAELLLDTVRNAPVENRVMVRSFRHSFLRAMRATAPEIPLAALIQGNLRDWVTICRRAEADCISPRFRFVTRRAVRRAHERGLAVIPWTSNNPRDWARLIRAEVDAIVTDDPASLLHFCRQDRYSSEP